MLDRARAEAQRRGLSMIELMEADVESLVFEDASFDTCVSYNGLHCFADPQSAIAEIARVLRPGGELRGSAAVYGTGARQDAVIRAYRRAGIFGRCPTANELRSWLEGAGLAGVDVNTSGVVAYYRARRAEPG
jgi:ubiquinone/menaquinone biosynthesis C-methylase UbiE